MGTNKYYVNYDAGTCLQDTDGSAEAWDELFDTKSECCQEKRYGLLKPSGEEVNEWYVKYDIMTCVQNSDGSAEAWDQLFDTKQACCRERLWYAEESCLQT